MQEFIVIMSISTLDVFGVISIVIVIIQLLRIVLPWFYETWVGPLILGNHIKFKEIGEWAGTIKVCTVQLNYRICLALRLESIIFSVCIIIMGWSARVRTTDCLRICLHIIFHGQGSSRESE